MILADLFTAIDRVSAGEVGFFAAPSKSEYVVDPRSNTLWDLKPVFGLMLETTGHDVIGGIHPMTSNALKDQTRAHLPHLGLVSFPEKTHRRLGMLRHDYALPQVDWQGAVAQAGMASPPTAIFGADQPGAAPYYMAMTKVYLRDPAVVQSARTRAAGKCEHCHQPAPFVTAAGLPFLEVHHIAPLSQNGPDHGSNVLALCPNCHRMAHHGANGLI